MYGIDWRLACRCAYPDSSLTLDLSFDPEELEDAKGLAGLGRFSASVENALGLKSRGDGVRFNPFAGRDGTGRPVWGSASPAAVR